MLATGLRAFSPAAKQSQSGLLFNELGVLVGGIPLLVRTQSVGGRDCWTLRPINEINDDLSAVYRLPVDVTAKAGALALIAKALNHGDLTLALVAAAQMRFPDPPLFTTPVEKDDEVAHRAIQRYRSGLLKIWDPAKHPRTGTPPNPGQFAPTGGEPESANVIPAAMTGNPETPWDLWGNKPFIVEGGGGGGVPRGQLELPFPRVRWPWQSSPEPPNPAPKPPVPSEAQPALPFPEELPPQLAPYRGGKTYGIFRSGDLTVELQSGYDGPTATVPPGSPGLDYRTRSHVEAQAATLMRQEGISEGWLEISKPNICDRCQRYLERMLPPGATLHVILPDGTDVAFTGIEP